MTQGVSEKDTYIYRFIVFFPPGRMKNMHKVYIKWGGTGYKSFTVVQDAGARWIHFDGDENYRNYQLSKLRFPSSKWSSLRKKSVINYQSFHSFLSWKRSVQWINESIHHGFKWKERNFFLWKGMATRWPGLISLIH